MQVHHTFTLRSCTHLQLTPSKQKLDFTFLMRFPMYFSCSLAILIISSFVNFEIILLSYVKVLTGIQNASTAVFFFFPRILLNIELYNLNCITNQQVQNQQKQLQFFALIQFFQKNTQMRQNFIEGPLKMHKKQSSNFSQTTTRLGSAEHSPLQTPKNEESYNNSSDEISHSKNSDIFKIFLPTHSRNLTAEISTRDGRRYQQIQNQSIISQQKSFNAKDLKDFKDSRRNSNRSIQTVRSNFKKHNENKMLPVTRQCKRRQGTMPKKTCAQFFNFLSSSHEKLAQKGKSQLLSQSLSDYINKITQQQFFQDICQIKRLKQALQKYTAFNGNDYASFICSAVMKKVNNNAQLWDCSIGRTFTKNLPKLLYFISYQSYCLKQCKGVNYQILIIINKDIQYYSRRLGFYKVSIKSCFDIAELFCNTRKYDMAEQYYRRVLKLAVVENDIYSQEKAIDKIGLCAYYQGKINEADYYHRNIHNLSHNSIVLIKDNYCHQSQIAKLFKQKFHVNCEIQPTQKNNISKETFNFGQTSGRKNLAKENLINMEKDLNQMIRISNVRGQIPRILRTQQKVKNVGLKRYHGKFYIQPKRTKFTVRQPENNQILLSHRSSNRFNNDWQRKKIDKQCQVLMDLLNNMTNGDLKDRFKTTPTQQQI